MPAPKPVAAAPAAAAPAPAKAAPAAAPEAVVPAAPAAAVADEESEKETLKMILTDMISNLEALKMKLDREVELASAKITSEEGEMLLMQRYQEQLQEGLQMVETTVQDKYNVAQAELMQLQSKYGTDAEIMVLMGELRKLFFGDDMPDVDPETVEVPEGMTADKFFEKFSKHVDIVNKAFEDAVKEAKKAAPKGEKRLEFLGRLMYSRMEEVNRKAVEAVGLTDEVFQSCIFRYQADPRFFGKLEESKRQQEEARRVLMEDD